MRHATFVSALPVAALTPPARSARGNDDVYWVVVVVSWW